MTLTADPRSTESPADRAVQDRAALRLYDMVQRLAYLVDAATELKGQAQTRAAGFPPRDRLARRLGAFADTLEAFRASLVSTSAAGRMAGEERLREKVVGLYGAVNGYEGRPTDSQLEQMELLAGRLDATAARFQTLSARTAALNRDLAARTLEALSVLSREAWDQR